MNTGPTPTAPRTLHVISHTHWDREWYLTFQQFRFRLVQLIDRLMDLLDANPDFRYFHLDAQTICVEDYLAVKPQNRDRLYRFFREGRILTGPWYQQNDMFLTSGESTIRNLLVGYRMAAEIAGPERVMMVGYLPDQFGNISQAPQILRGFGIGTAVQGRGYDVRKTGSMEYWWEGPDGSRLLTSNLAFWYNNFERIPDTVEAGVARVRALEERYMGPVAKSRHLLFMNGVDHFEAQAELPEKMAAVNEAAPATDGPPRGRLVHSTLPAYFEALQAEVDAGLDLPVHEGELRHGPSLGGLPGTLSSRVTLKQRNARCQTLLERYAEPLCAIAATLGRPYPQEWFTYVWKLLMQNHPHDSICGCSQDQVHREMIPRFDQVDQVAEEIIHGAFAAAAQSLPAPAPVDLPGRQTTFAVFNPLSFARTDIAEVVLDFPLGRPGRDRGEVDPKTDVEFLALFDDAGAPVPYHIVKSEIVQERALSPTVLPMAQVHRRFTVQVRAENVPPLGFRAFRAVGQDWSLAQKNAGSTVATGALAGSNALTARAQWLQNHALEVALMPGGAFQPTLKPDDADDEYASYEWMGFFEDGGDVGDQYVYRAPRRDTVLTTENGAAQWELVEDTPLAAAYRARLTLEVPAEKSADREERSAQRVALPVETTVRLRAGQPYVEVTTVVHNVARDHRLRVRFPARYDLRANEGLAWDSTVAQCPFDVVERERVPVEQLREVAGQHPHEQWVEAFGRPTEDEAEPYGLAVFTEGLYEHELLRDDRGTLALTLLRGTDRLAMNEKDPLGHDRAPDGQCPGTHTFRYAVMPHGGNWEDAEVWKHAHAFLAPLRALQTPESHRGNVDHNAPAPPENAVTRPAYLTLEPEALVLSACKRAHDRDTLVLRFWNIGTDPVSGRVGFAGAKTAWRVNLNEERQAELPIQEDGTVSLTVHPKEIITLELDV